MDWPQAFRKACITVAITGGICVFFYSMFRYL